MAKGKASPKGAFEENGLTERDKVLLEALPGTVPQILATLRTETPTHAMREVLIGRLWHLQLQGYIRQEGRPPTWYVTKKGEEALA